MRASGQIDQAPQFLAWCKTQGIALRNCGIQHYKDTGRGIGASEDIQKGEVILNVPDDAVLMPSTCSIAKARAVTSRSLGFGSVKTTALTPSAAIMTCLNGNPSAQPGSCCKWVATA